MLSCLRARVVTDPQAVFSVYDQARPRYAPLAGDSQTGKHFTGAGDWDEHGAGPPRWKAPSAVAWAAASAISPFFLVS